MIFFQSIKYILIFKYFNFFIHRSFILQQLMHQSLYTMHYARLWGNKAHGAWSLLIEITVPLAILPTDI